MTTIDHQQAAIEAMTVDFRPSPYLNSDQNDEQRSAYWVAMRDKLAAATPHLRAGIAEELLDDTPGSPLTRGYQRLMDPKPGEHPVRTWEAAVRVMLDTLLEGGGEDK